MRQHTKEERKAYKRFIYSYFDRIGGVMYCENHKEEALCDCGANVMCYTCGVGHGQIPCDCTKDQEPELEICDKCGTVLGVKEG